MEWARKLNGEDVKASDKGASSWNLICPVCKSRVYHRKEGNSRKSHFAHYNGNSSRDCELYTPGSPGSIATNELPKYFDTANSRSHRPALIWTDNELFEFSFKLRLPIFSPGREIEISVATEFGTRRFFSEELTKPVYTPVRLQILPANVSISPADLDTELRLKNLLEEFKLLNNFFHITGEGGVLEGQNAPLVLGEEYFLVTQKPIECAPCQLEILDIKDSLPWFAYRLRLKHSPHTSSADVRILEKYFNREILPPTPQISIVWPPPNRYEIDGTHVFDDKVEVLIVRSLQASPESETESSIDIRFLGDGLYEVKLRQPMTDLVLTVQGRAYQRVRFEKCYMLAPKGVELGFNGRYFSLFDQSISNIVKMPEKFEVTVPSNRLWKKIIINNKLLDSALLNDVYVVNDDLLSVKAGSFGGFFAEEKVIAYNCEHYFSNAEGFVVSYFGTLAFLQLCKVKTKHQLFRWAISHNANNALPLLMKYMS